MKETFRKYIKDRPSVLVLQQDKIFSLFGNAN